MELHWSERPTLSLGMLTSTVLPETWISAPISEKFPWSRALANWYALNHLMINRRSEVDRLMHPDQLRIYSLLYDWWTAAYQDPGISLSIILEIVSQSDDLEKLASIGEDQPEATNWPRSSIERQKVFRSILSHLELKSWPTEETIDVPSRSIQEGQYHHVMFTLFENEFQRFYEEGNLNSEWGDGQRKTWRNKAIAAAYCQQFATNLYASATSRWITPPSALESLELGPALDNCTWLPDLPADRSQSMPHYLWDIHQHRTVESASLGASRAYTCISHTWGRWRIRGAHARLPGVPWPVPRNRKFRVEDLPVVLHHAPSTTRYVWLDLLCIPQDRSALGDAEIARQGDIFRGALHVLVWLNDIARFGALRHVVAYAALHFLRLRPGSVEQRARDGLVRRARDAVAGQRSSLFVGDPYPPPEELHRSAGDLLLSPWFSSLWTLQEVCLRPDMWLCDADWNVLSVDGRSAMPINGLVCLLSKFMVPEADVEAPGYGVVPEVFTRGFFDDAENLPLFAFREVALWYYGTGLEVLLNLSRVDILALGDRRKCTGRRAEAIMSALGVTDWFVPGGQNDRDLVLDKYPLGFVRELQKKMPGEFFGSINRSASASDASKDPNSERESDLCGCLMPFGRANNGFVSSNLFKEKDVVSHPSLSTWITEPPHGHVRIGSACIISSPSKARSHHPREVLSSSFSTLGRVWPEEDLPRNHPVDTVHHVEDLHQWVRERKYDVYMVATQYRDVNLHFKSDVEEISDRNLQIRGIVLKGNDTQSLIKMGFFTAILDMCLDPIDKEEQEFVLGWKLPPAEEVNWRVL
ncbi:hypothetical protein GTA08_BOTSDO10933 [Botryosphaeria dothidea]|uniref:Heterokaryon incompatibility domain-containing protein n=1 Tax=Botryosphaeria dothidea TaxID=55169 RepID=A0A8H4MVV7_9PEZI|nr:hypothetical protein GTA08_BOTSDO10933 [Botryosphaeria dothidea]